MANTMFIRKDGKTSRVVEEMTQKELRAEARANGFKVVKIFKGNVGYDKLDEWEWMNRKQEDFYHGRENVYRWFGSIDNE